MNHLGTIFALHLVKMVSEKNGFRQKKLSYPAPKVVYSVVLVTNSG